MKYLLIMYVYIVFVKIKINHGFRGGGIKPPFIGGPWGGAPGPPIPGYIPPPGGPSTGPALNAGSGIIGGTN